MTGFDEDQKQRIQAQLDRILSSAAFSGSDRHKRFLRFVVEETLKGHADRLSEFVLGFEVFNKSESFDPRIDSIDGVDPVFDPLRSDPHFAEILHEIGLTPRD